MVNFQLCMHTGTSSYPIHPCLLLTSVMHAVWGWVYDGSLLLVCSIVVGLLYCLLHCSFYGSFHVFLFLCFDTYSRQVLMVLLVTL